MARRDGIGESLHSARKHLIMKEIQAAVGRELAARSEVPNTMPRRIADLLRELHGDDCVTQARRWRHAPPSARVSAVQRHEEPP